MKLKTTEIEGVTYAAVKDGKPVYESNGEEIPFDAAHATRKIEALNAEAQKYRERQEAAEAKISGYKGLDPEEARKAIETVRALDDKELLDAKKVDEIKAAAIRSTEEKMQAALSAKDEEIQSLQQDRDGLKSTLSNEMIGGSFSRSPWVQENVAIPYDLLQSRFGDNFKVEDGELVAYDQSGNKIYSKTKPGDLATFDEAIEMLVQSYPQRDGILKGRGNTGGGARGNGAGGSDKAIPRSEWDKISPYDQMAKMQDGYTVTDG